MVSGDWNFHASETLRDQDLTTTNDLTKGFNIQSYNADLSRFKSACQIYLKEYGKGIIVRWSTPDSQRKDGVFATFSYFCNKHGPPGPPVHIGETIKAGTLVEVRGLLDKASLNGEKGVTEEFSSAPGRVGVRLFDNRIFAFNPKNLKVLDGFTHSWTLYTDPRKKQSLGTNLNADCHPLFGVDFASFKVFCFTFQYHLSRKFGFDLSLKNGLRGTDKSYSFRSVGHHTIINTYLYKTLENLKEFLHLKDDAKKIDNNMIKWQNAKKWNKELSYVATTTGELFTGKAQHEQWLNMILEWFGPNDGDKDSNSAKKTPAPPTMASNKSPNVEKDNSVKKTAAPQTVTGNEPEIIDLSDSEPDQDAPHTSTSPQPSTSTSPQPSTSSIKMVNIDKLTNPVPSFPSNPYPQSNLDPMSMSEHFLAGHSIFGPSLPTPVISTQSTVTSTPAVHQGRFAPKPSFEGPPIPKLDIFHGRPSTSTAKPAPMTNTNLHMGVKEVKLVFDLPANKRAGLDMQSYRKMLYDVVSNISRVHGGGGGYKIALNGPDPANNIFAVISYGCHKHVVKNPKLTMPGTLVQVTNLSKKPLLNGKRGTVQNMFDPSSGRINILLDNASEPDKVYALKPDNIHVIEFTHNWTMFLDPTVNTSNPSDIRCDCLVNQNLDYPKFLQTIQTSLQIFARRFGFRVTVPVPALGTLGPKTNPNPRGRPGPSAIKRTNHFPDRSDHKRARVEVPLQVITETSTSGARGSGEAKKSTSGQNSGFESSFQKTNPLKTPSSTQATPPQTQKSSPVKSSSSKPPETPKISPVKISSPKQATQEPKKSSQEHKSSKSPNCSISELIDSPEKNKTSVIDISEDVVEIKQEGEPFETMYDKVKQRHGEKEKSKSKETPEDESDVQKKKHKLEEALESQKDNDLDDFKLTKSPEKKTRKEQEEEISRLKRKLEKYQTRSKKYKDMSKHCEEVEKRNTQLSKKLNKTEKELKDKEKKGEDTKECMNGANKQISELRVTISELRAGKDETDEVSKKKIEKLEYDLQQCRKDVDESMAEIKARDAKILKLQITQSPVMLKKEDKSEGDEDHDSMKKELEKLKSKMSKMKDLLKIKDKEIATYKSMASDSEDEDDKVNAKLPTKETCNVGHEAVKYERHGAQVNQEEDEDENNPFKNLEITAITIKEEVDMEEEPAPKIKEELDLEPIIEPAPKAAKYFNPDFETF